jgi:hypothetical protein
MNMLISQSPDTDSNLSTLPDLWRRRTRLSAKEMLSIYLLVQQALRAYYPPELRVLVEDKDELVARFIYSKVLRLDSSAVDINACADSAPSNGYAICAYFRRYLIDCLRSASHQRHVSIEIDGIEQEVDLRAHALEDPVESVLIQYALNEKSVRQKASTFIASLDEADQLILAGSFGWCSGQKGGLAGIATTHQIPSYHYRAVKLGVTVKKSGTLDHFAQSKIGQWLIDQLGISICIDNRPAILVALNLLSQEASLVPRLKAIATEEPDTGVAA